MKEKTIIIIGAGIAGLSAGCYAQMNGYRSKIFELHDLPGGLCTSWERNDFLFDGSIHYLFGSGTGQSLNQMWQELGAVQGRQMVNHAEYQRITDGERTLIVYTDPDRLEAHLLEISPGDTKPICAFCDGVRQFTHFNFGAMYQKPRSLMTIGDWFNLIKQMLPFTPALAKWALLSCGDFGNRFEDPFLRRSLPLMFSWKEAPVMMGMMLLAYMHIGNAGYPVGGSLEFARAIEKRFLQLGGEIYYEGQVEKILVENDRAVGVRLYNDETYFADYIVSTADGRSTIFDLLSGEYTNRGIRSMYDGHLPILQMLQVSLGVNRDLSDEPHWITYLLDDPVLISGQYYTDLGIQHYCFDPTMAPEGKSVIIVFLRTRYDYWKRIYGRRLYDREQSQASGMVIEKLDQISPGIADAIETVDEATPVSYERYTGNWLGATSGWLLAKQTMPMMLLGVRKTLPGLSHFYMAGQWVEPGGTVTLAAASGRGAIQLICEADGKAFTSSKP